MTVVQSSHQMFVRRAVALVVTVTSMLAGSATLAFTFADGSSVACVAQGVTVTEIHAGPDEAFAKLGRTALAERTDGGYRITWHTQRLNGLPPEVRDFIFFHECAHARVPTEIELEANCAGLLDMRAAGRAGPAFEKKLRAYFPPDNEYWTATFACADAAANSPQRWP